MAIPDPGPAPAQPATAPPPPARPDGDAAGDGLATGAARDERFPKRFRILVRRDFLRIQGQGQRIHGRLLVYQFQAGRTAASRLGITASKKVGNSVVRNRIKRWVREVFRRHPELRPDGRRQTFDLVVTAKSNVGEFTFAGLESEIIATLHRYLAAPAGQRSGSRPPGSRPRERGRPR